MKYSLFIFSLLSFTSGTVGLTLSVSLFLKTRSKFYIYYIIWLSAYTLYLILDNIFFFSNAILFQYEMYYNTLTVLLLFSSYGLQFYFLPRWLHEYCGIPFTPVKKIFFGGLTLSSIFLVFLPFIITDDQFAQIKMNVINLQIIIWIMYFIKISIIYFIVRNIKKVETKEKKLLLKTIAIFMLLFFPIWILSFFIEFYYYPLLDLLNSSYLQYLIWNIIFIVFFGKNIFLTPNLPLQNEITDSFLKKYGITQREKEIILLIARGLANKQIAFELKISNVTIKNHIYNIYKKTGAQSKVELINLISTGSHSHNQILSI